MEKQTRTKTRVNSEESLIRQRTFIVRKKKSEKFMKTRIETGGKQLPLTRREKERTEDAPRRLRRGQDNPISFLCKISVHVAC